METGNSLSRHPRPRHQCGRRVGRGGGRALRLQADGSQRRQGVPPPVVGTRAEAAPGRAQDAHGKVTFPAAPRAAAGFSSYVLGASKLKTPISFTRRGSVPLTLMLFKGQLCFHCIYSDRERKGQKYFIENYTISLRSINENDYYKNGEGNGAVYRNAPWPGVYFTFMFPLECDIQCYIGSRCTA